MELMILFSPHGVFKEVIDVSVPSECFDVICGKWKSCLASGKLKFAKRPADVQVHCKLLWNLVCYVFSKIPLFCCLVGKFLKSDAEISKLFIKLFIMENP